MLTIPLNQKNKPIYEQMYEYIKKSISTGDLMPNNRLPSKRKLADHHNVSISTVENAYAQLLAEGYIYSIEKKGYYVCEIEHISTNKNSATNFHEYNEEEENPLYDMKSNTVNIDNFPFLIWSKLMRLNLRNEKEQLLKKCHPQGELLLRQEIANYLKSYRNMNVLAEQIILGAGTEYLLGLIAELVPERKFAIESPCYQIQSKLLQSKQISYETIPMDSEGMRGDLLMESSASIAIITPSRHFPLGTVMSIKRRMQLLKWAAEDENRYIIEDDYDNEYRYALKQIPTMHSLDNSDNVIYMNTFTRTLTPSLRIGYIILPPKLLHRYWSSMNFYSCTVSAFEQSTLRRFLHDGYYERHISRMRSIYKNNRDVFLKALEPLKCKFEIWGYGAGLHLLVKSTEGVSEHSLLEKALKVGVRVYGLSNYYEKPPQETNTVIIGYGQFNEKELKSIAELLIKAWI